MFQRVTKLQNSTVENPKVNFRAGNHQGSEPGGKKVHHLQRVPQPDGEDAEPGREGRGTVHRLQRVRSG